VKKEKIGENAKPGVSTICTKHTKYFKKQDIVKTYFVLSKLTFLYIPPFLTFLISEMLVANIEPATVNSTAILLWAI